MGKILVVDDSKVARMEVSGILTAAGYEVLEACGGLEGIQLAQNNPDVKIILADYNMPEMNGLVMLDSIKDISAHKETFCGILTTESSSTMKEIGRSIGVDVWIGKPVDPQNLVKLTGVIMSKL